MSKLSIIKEDVIDTYKEHEAYHQSYHSDCSSCYSENRAIQAWKVVNSKKVEEQLLGINNQSKLRGGLFGNSSPWDMGRE
jgi:hypothetical protein